MGAGWLPSSLSRRDSELGLPPHRGSGGTCSPPPSPASTCSARSFFLRLCSEVPILEDTLMRILVIGLSRELPLGPADAMELADHLVKRAAAVQADGEGPSRLCPCTPHSDGVPQPGSAPGACVRALGLLGWVCFVLQPLLAGPYWSLELGMG